MHTYDVELTLPNGEPAVRETVKAASWIDAIAKVLEPFKSDARVSDADSWDVNIRRLDTVPE